MLGLIAVVALVGVGEALALEVDDSGTLSVSAVGALSGAALFGTRAALPLAITIVVVAWSAQRQRLYQLLFNGGALTLASLAAVGAFSLAFNPERDKPWFALAGLARRRDLLRRQHGAWSRSRSPSRGASRGGRPGRSGSRG